MNSESVNDAELDAFLKGEDALASELQAMQQASPSAELDAAILAQAEALMAQERPPVTRPAAANDADAGPARRQAHAGLRWRAPVGIAAALIAGVLAQQSWQSEADIERLARQPAASAPALAPTPAPALAPAPALEIAPAPAALATAAPAAPKQTRPPQVPRKVAPTEVPTSHASALVVKPAPPLREAELAPKLDAAPSSRGVIAAPAPAPAYSLRYSPAPAFAPAPAPAAAAAPATAPGQVQALARRSRVEVPPPPAAPSTTAKFLAGTPDPAVWLAAIDEMLRAGLRRDTLEEWDKFRAAYPDYPVPAPTMDQINALRR